MRSERQVGRDLKTLGHQCLVRQKSKHKQELKNTKVNICDYVGRDYHNLLHQQDVYATDVSFLAAPKDLEQKHIYLSAIISHRTKAIIGYYVSMYND